MKNNIYTVLDELTDQYVPDKLDDIMAEIAKQPDQEASAPTITVVRTNSNWKHIAAAACLCAIIASSAMIIPNLQNNTVDPNTTIENTKPHSTVIVDEKDTVQWNSISLRNNVNLLAGEFKEVSKEEWLSYYPIKLLKNNNATYYLVYAISKEDGSTTNDIMCGYIDFNLSNGSDFTMYVVSSPLGLSNNMLIDDFTDSTPKKSHINGKEVYLGAAADKRCAAFNDGNYSFYARMSNVEAEQSIELLKGILN